MELFSLLCWVDIVDLAGEPWWCFQIRGCKPCILAAPEIDPNPALLVLSLLFDERLKFCFAADLRLLMPQSRKTCLHHQRFLLPQVLVQHPSLAACMKSRVPLSLVCLFTSCPGNDHVSGWLTIRLSITFVSQAMLRLGVVDHGPVG